MARSTMLAAVLHGPRDVRVEQRQVTEPGPRDVLVEVSHCGVCGSDLHLVLEGWGRPGSVGGHEWSGRVVAVGDDVQRYAVGDAVVGGAELPCGECPGCGAGRPSLCVRRQAVGSGGDDGAFAELIRRDERMVEQVPDGLDLRSAALAEPLAVAMHAVARSGVEAGQRALVTGAGPIGALAVVALGLQGVTDIVVSEPNPARRALASRLGATKVVAPDVLEVPTVAEPSRVVSDAVDVALECSGKAAAMVAACAQLTRGGTLVLVGAGMDRPRFDPNRILINELVVTGAFEYEANGIADALAVLASGAIDVAAMVEPEDVSLADLPTAMDKLGSGDLPGKVLVAPSMR